MLCFETDYNIFVSQLPVVEFHLYILSDYLSALFFRDMPQWVAESEVKYPTPTPTFPKFPTATP